MAAVPWEGGGIAYQAEVALSAADAGRAFHWSVLVDGADVRDAAAIVTELDDGDAAPAPRLQRRFVLGGTLEGSRAPGVESYHLSFARRLGAQKLHRAGRAQPALRFSAWAP